MKKVLLAILVTLFLTCSASAEVEHPYIFQYRAIVAVNVGEVVLGFTSDVMPGPDPSPNPGPPPPPTRNISTPIVDEEPAVEEEEECLPCQNAMQQHLYRTYRGSTRGTSGFNKPSYNRGRYTSAR